MSIKIEGHDSIFLEAIGAVFNYSETRQLLQRVCNDGPITIKHDEQLTNAGEWSLEGRTIFLNGHSSLAARICTLVEELFNARSNRELLAIKQARLNIEEYVSEMERVEHENVAKAAAVIERAIGQRVFPIESRVLFFKHFDLYYKWQQLHGHSQYTAEYYERHATQVYQGTWEPEIPSGEDRTYLIRLMTWKWALLHGSKEQKQEASQKLHESISQLAKKTDVVSSRRFQFLKNFLTKTQLNKFQLDSAIVKRDRFLLA